MKKIIFLVAFATLSVLCLGQASTVLIRGDTARVYKQGDTATLKVDSLAVITGQQIIGKSYFGNWQSSTSLGLYDTTRAMRLNKPYSRRAIASPVSGMQIYEDSTGKFLCYEGGKWGPCGVSVSNETKLISGGIVSWDSLLIFGISPAVYFIDGYFYTSPDTHITLDPAHATLPRIDMIYLDSTGVHKITGDASATPSEPNLPPNSIRLTVVQVDALATNPTAIDTLTIYDENVEWVGSANSVTTNFAGTTNVYHFVKTTDLGAVTSASYIQYTAISTIRISRYSILKFSVRLKSAFANGTQLQITWRRAGVLQSSTLNIANGNFGFVRTNNTSYQTLSIPIYSWSFLSDSIDQIRFAFTGSNTSGCYIDLVQLQEGLPQPIIQGQNLRFGVSGEDAVMTQGRFAHFGNQYFMNFDSVTSFIISAQNTRFQGLNPAATPWMQYAIASDTISINRKASYPGNIHGLFNARSLVDKSYVDSVASASVPNLNAVTAVGHVSLAGIDIQDDLISPTQKVSFGYNGTTGQMSMTNTSGFRGTIQNGIGTGFYTFNMPNADGTLALKQDLKSKGLTLETPSSSESFGMWQTQVAITVSSLKAVLVGSSPSVTYNIKFGTDRTSGTNVFTSDITCTNTTTGCSNSSGFNDATIPAGSFIWFVSTASSGTITQIEITINYTED